MDADFWHQRWAENNIGFHANEPNPLLVDNLAQLQLSPGARVFIPLCGKTLDIGWLLQQGFSVVGVELSELAIRQLFTDLGLTPEVAELGGHKHFKHGLLDIFVGDVFALTPELVGKVDAVYDRAALVALPKPMREQYVAQLMKLTAYAPQLLVCYEYDQQLMDGPPFSVSDAEVSEHYAEHYHLEKILSLNVSSSKRPDFSAKEHVWLLDSNR